MNKKLFLLLTLISYQMRAMESGELPLFRNKDIKVVFANGESKKWPEESHQVSALERKIGEKAFNDFTQQWTALITRGAQALQDNNFDEQDRVFKEAIELYTRPSQSGVHVESTNGPWVRLFHMALFCNTTNLYIGAYGIWDKLLMCKEHIDTCSFTKISIKDQQLFRRLYQFPCKACHNKMKCYECNDAVTAHVAIGVVGDCCRDKLRLGVVCDTCALKIKNDVSLQLCCLVAAFHDFQTPVIAMKHAALVEWAFKTWTQVELKQSGMSH